MGLSEEIRTQMNGDLDLLSLATVKKHGAALGRLGQQ
jgi:hypothetical protein